MLTAPLLTAAPLLTLAELEAFDQRATRTALEIITRCPFCEASERAFHVNRQSGLFNCKRAACGAKGKLQDFWDDRPKLTRQARFKANVTRALALAPVAPAPAPENSPAHWREVGEIYEAALSLDEGGAAPACDFLTRRGIAWEIAHQTGARFCPQWAPRGETSKPYPGAPAILFPLRDLDGSLRAVNGRYLMPQPTKDGGTVKARTGGNAKEGAFWVATPDTTPRNAPALLVVEGPIDALATALCGVPALALCGTAPPSWLGRAAGLRPCYIALDADAGGDNAAPALIDALTYQMGAQRLRPEGGKDFGEALENHGRQWLARWLCEHAPALFPPHPMADTPGALLLISEALAALADVGGAAPALSRWPDLHLQPPGVWCSGGFIIPTRATLPAIRELRRRQKAAA
jgi:hypothetical protein